MSNIDLRMILPELRQAIEGGFIKNIYQYGQIFVLKVYQPGGQYSQLLLQPGVRVHLTHFRRVAERVPSKFVAVLRKYLREKRIVSIGQHDLDRILLIQVGESGSSYKLVVELFGQGNLILLDPEDRVFIALSYRKMRDRDIVPRAKYEFPPQRGIDIFEIEDTAIKNIISDSNASLIRTLASRLNLDATSCEEICSLAGLSPTMNVSEMSPEAQNDLAVGIRRFAEKLRGGVSRPRVVLYHDTDEQNPEPVAFLPFEFSLYAAQPHKEFQSFSEAIDEFFGVSEDEITETEDPARAAERNRLQRIIEKQSESLDHLMVEAQQKRREGDLIYANFQVVNDVLNTLNSARSNGTEWDEIIRRIDEGRSRGHEVARLIQEIDPSAARVTVLLDGVQVRLDTRLSAQENASHAYELAKKLEKKADGARLQIEKAQSRMNELDLVPIQSATTMPVRTRKRRWYEKYRWFISSEGFLVLGGRDAKSNELLAKRQLEPNDIFLHAALHGAPYTVIKVPQDPPGTATLWEAAQFAVSFSRAWQDGLTSGDAYWVTPDQVSFSPPTGEYLPSGGVMIYGSRNYLKNVPIDVSAGIILDDQEGIPVCGPTSAVKKNTPYSVRIYPGSTKKSQLVKGIVARLASMLPEESRSVLHLIPEEDWMRVLPPGDGRLE